MKEIVLRPIRETYKDYEELEQEVSRMLREEIYLPLLSELNQPKKLLSNSIGDLINAINSGRIVYSKGKFSGRFSARLSKELKLLRAKWKEGDFYIPKSQLPPAVKQAISYSEAKFQRVLEQIDKRLKKLVPDEMVSTLKLEKIFDHTLFKTGKDVESTLKGISVAPELTKEQRAKIAEEYTHDLKRYIKDFSEKEIVTLRKKIQKNAEDGFRYEEMIETIRRSYGVTERKARFLARQETSLLMTKFKESRYIDAGVNEYIWTCVVGSPAHPVRPMHKKLDGKTFRWDNPPITNPEGQRNNPGQDFNCRCVARPIIRF